MLNNKLIEIILNGKSVRIGNTKKNPSNRRPRMIVSMLEQTFRYLPPTTIQLIFLLSFSSPPPLSTRRMR